MKWGLGCGRVWEDVGGYRRVWEGVEGVGVCGSVWECVGGSGRMNND